MEKMSVFSIENPRFSPQCEHAPYGDKLPPDWGDDKMIEWTKNNVLDKNEKLFSGYQGRLMRPRVFSVDDRVPSKALRSGFWSGTWVRILFWGVQL